MRFKLVSVGRRRADQTAPLVSDYLGRLNKFLPVEEVVLRTERQDRLAERIFRESKGSDLLVALDEGGQQYDSKGFSGLVSSWMNRGVSKVVFVIGGADGLPGEVRRRAGLVVSLSSMTLPHRLARLLLAEQLYRAMCAIRKVPYQK